MKVNRMYLLSFIFLLILSNCMSVPSSFMYRASSIMSKDEIEKKYSICVENKEMGQVLSEHGLDLTEKQNTKKLFLKVFFYKVDDLNLNRGYLPMTSNLKFIGIDAETKQVIFEVFAKYIMDYESIDYADEHFRESGDEYSHTRSIYVYRSLLGGVEFEQAEIEKTKKSIDHLMKEAIKLIGENVYIDNIKQQPVDEILKEIKKQKK